MMWPLVAVCGSAGAVAGSFVTNWAIRSARGQQAVTGRSTCDACGAPLSFLRSIPVLSYAIESTRCRDCAHPIDKTHPIGELTGLAFGVFAANAPSLAEGLCLAMLGLALLASAIIDARTMRLPRALTLIIALSAAALAYFRHTFPEAVISALIIGSLLLGLHLLRTRSGVAPIGIGDVKLAAALALWLGPASGWMIGVAAVAGLGFVLTRAQRPERLAFGTALAFGAIVGGFTLEVMSWRAQV